MQKKKWLDKLPPYQGGGGMISEVLKEKVTFAETPTKFEAGTMQTAEVVAFSEAIKFIEKIGIQIYRAMRMKLWSMELKN